jgi:hypothetical protein
MTNTCEKQLQGGKIYFGSLFQTIMVGRAWQSREANTMPTRKQRERERELA